MGSGISRTTVSDPSRQRRRPTIRRSISSYLFCGASSSREMDDYPAELLVNSAERARQQKLKFRRKKSNLSDNNGDNRISTKPESVVSSARGLSANENPAPESGASNLEPGNKGKWLFDSRDLVAPVHNSRGNETASTSYAHQPSPHGVSSNEMPSGEGHNNSSTVYRNGLRESLLDEVSVENNVSEEVDFSNSEFGSSSFVSDSPGDYHLRRDDAVHEETPSGLGFVVSERDQSRQDGSLLHVDVVSISSNGLLTNSADISSREARRNSRRLFWDAFSRRSSRRDSRTLLFSPGDSDHLRSHERWLLDFSGGFLNNDENGGDLRSHDSRTPSSEQRWNSRSEIWGRLRGSIDSTDHTSTVCPTGLHSDGSCSCQTSSSVEESGARAGISRIVMLAEALFEVLDQIHQQPMSLSLSMVSLPAPESVVDSFPVKTHGQTETSETASDVSQCYICLAEYEDGDKIRILPCHHEFHMSCVDKWLKEIHGVCPLCRGDVREGFTEGSTSN
ncbi:hypothetical protein ACP275_11G038700 [Erythranthe tilingii]